MNRMRRHLVLGVVAALGLFVAAVASAASLGATAPAAKPSAKAPSYKAPQFTLQATIVIRSDEEKGKKGPDGKWHDAFLPANFTALKGVPVKVTIYNYDDMPHSFNAPGLHVNQVIMPGSESKPSSVTFTFTPKKKGSFVWHCDPKCDPWAMAHWGFMKGHVTVF